MFRRTIKKETELSGIALHCGAKTKIVFKPGNPKSGIVFVRADLPGRPRIRASPAKVSDTKRGTTLSAGAARIQVVEHVLAAIFALGISDIEIEVAGPEPPALDGSALPYFRALKEVGIVVLEEENQPITVFREIVIQKEGSLICASPSDRFSVSFVVDFPDTIVGGQKLSLEINEETFEREIAPARTFGFIEEVENLKRAGLALGASLDNALAISSSGYINEPRFKDEVVRHKILDLIGDLGLLGRPVNAHVVAERSNHRLNIELASALERKIK